MTAQRIIVIGAGPAGTRAAARLVEAGLRPIVIDEGERQGGQIYRRQPPHFTRPPEKLYGSEAPKAVALHRDFEALREKIDYRPNTLAWGAKPGMLMTVTGDEAREVPYDALIIASGATDRVMPMPGWTVPGVYTLGAAQIALKAQACAIGAAPIFTGTGPLLYLVAWQYMKAGVKVRAVLDTSPFSLRLKALRYLAARPEVLRHGMGYTADLKRAGVQMANGITPLEVMAHDGRVAGLRWRDAAGREQSTEGDAVGFGYGLRSETQIADLLKCDFAFDSIAKQWLPVVDSDGRSSKKGVYLAGDGAMVRGADAAEMAGRLAACAALLDMGLSIPAAEIEKLRAQLAPMGKFRQGLEMAFPWPGHQAASLPDSTIICRCEKVTAGDIRHAAKDLDTPEVNRTKQLVRPGMGRCQGRMCGLAAAEVLAAARGVPAEQVGRLRGAAPIKPLPIGARLVESA
ncbi:NAD(P)/FAD-dependent oxidoreductase [Acetobacteraceae bacterium H6797]|nr:NAD(P)/FAD-dependent oxidoreductase [Acetobacteraceae bacterium H6797]